MSGGHVYLAGKMRGVPHFNFLAFYAAEVRLRISDPTATIMNPARRDVEQHGPSVLASPTGDLADVPQFDLREALGLDLAWICEHATEVHMLPGWQTSKGAVAERATAIALGIDVTYADGATPGTSEYREGYLAGLAVPVNSRERYER